MGPFANSILLFCMFFVAMALEILLPTAGVLLVVALICAGTSLYFAWTIGGWFLAGMVLAYLLSIPSLAWVFKVLWPYSPIGRVTEGNPIAEAVDPQSDAKKMIGQKGKVIIELRPNGTMAIGDRHLSATSKSGTISVDEIVQVVEVRMNRLYVLPEKWIKNQYTEQAGDSNAAEQVGPKQGANLKADESPDRFEKSKPTGKPEQKSGSSEVLSTDYSEESSRTQSGSSGESGKFENFDWE